MCVWVRVWPVGMCACVRGLWVRVRAWPVGEGACVACECVSVCVCVSGVLLLAKSCFHF